MRFAFLALRRLLVSIPTLVLIMIGLFLLLKMAPGDTVDALVAQMGGGDPVMIQQMRAFYGLDKPLLVQRSEEHTSELQSLMRISYAAFCLNKNKTSHLLIVQTVTTLLPDQYNSTNHIEHLLITYQP